MNYSYNIRLVDPSSESLEAGLMRELKEELGIAVPVTPQDHVVSCHAPSCPTLITHFYVKKMEESQIRELERAAVTMATDHGLEVWEQVFVISSNYPINQPTHHPCSQRLRHYQFAEND